MEVKTIKSLFVFIVCLFAVGVIVFAAGILLRYGAGRKNAQNDFRSVVNGTANVFQGGAEDAASVEAGMGRIFAAYRNLAAIDVRLNDVPVYAGQSEFGFISVSRNNEPAIIQSSPMLVRMSAAFTTRDGRRGLATAVFYALTPRTVYEMARISFLIILSATALSVLFVAIGRATRRKLPDAEPEDGDVSGGDISYDIFLNEARTPGGRAEEKPDVPTDDLDAAPLGADGSPQAEGTREENPDAGGAVFPVADFMEEALLESRLETELERATELEHDLALFVILLPEVEQGSQTAVPIYRLIANRFRYADLIFEYKSGGIPGVAAVVQNSPFDDSLARAERLYVGLNEVFPSVSSARFAIGVSNRAFRIISAKRLIGEADEAANRALKSPDEPIVALKIDPQKYREYLSRSDPADAGTASGSST